MHSHHTIENASLFSTFDKDVSVEKESTKVINNCKNIKTEIQIGVLKLECVTTFCYLRAMFSNEIIPSIAQTQTVAQND